MVRIVQARVGSSEEVSHRKGKRVLDVLGSGLGLLVLSLLLAITSTLRGGSPRVPVLFVIEHPGSGVEALDVILDD